MLFRQHDAAVLSGATRRGTLKRIARGIYSGALALPDEQLIRRNIWAILGYAFPGCVVVDDSALATDPLDNGRLCIAHLKKREWRLPGMTIVVRPGALGLAGDKMIAEHVSFSSPARIVLDYFAIAPAQRSADVFADWFRRLIERETVAFLQPLSFAFPGLAIQARREKVLEEAKQFLASRLAKGEPRSLAVASNSALSDLSGVAKIVGAALFERAAATRPELSAITGLSKPTVSDGITELQKVGLISQLFMQARQKRMCSQRVWHANCAGWVLGVDMGNDHALFIARSLEGKMLAQQHITNNAFHVLLNAADFMVITFQKSLAEHGPLYAVMLALSQAIRQDSYYSGREGPSQAGLTPNEIAARLGFPASVRLTMENNLNYAVAAEAISGFAKGLCDVIFLQIGTHIGAGIIAGGQLIRGVRGCAGEVADVPFPCSSAETPRELMLEKHLGDPDYLHRLSPSTSQGGRLSLSELLTRA